MKIQCSGCDAEEARVFCCADEAALCFGCDVKIHAANKLVSNHQRVPLSSSSSPLPKCDICQETFGYFLCLEDRALLCRKCDVAIHTTNSFVSNHQRFLLTGAKVGLESAKLGKSTEKFTSNPSMSRTSTNPSASQPQVATSSKDDNVVKSWSHETTELGIANGTTADSQFKEILDLVGSNHNTPSNQDGLHKAEGKAPGNSEWWKILRSTEEELLNDQWATSDDVSWKVPQLLLPYFQPDSCAPRDTGKTSSKNVFNVSGARPAGSPSGGDSQQASSSTKHQSRQRKKGSG